MNRPLIGFIFAAAISVSGFACADDISVNDAGDRPKLARLAFPLKEQPTFDDDLALLADVIVAKIEHPAPENYTHDRVVGHELIGIFELVRYWTNPKFAQPLRQNFTTTEIGVIECARALLAYQVADLRSVVMTRKDYSRKVKNTLRWQRNPKYEMINDLQQINLPAAAKFESLESLLPDWKNPRYEFYWPEGLSVPTAVSQLQAESQSVRLQSWIWLAGQGIIAPTDIALECWPKLTGDQQIFVARLKPRFLGSDRLLKLFERLADVSSGEPRHHLLLSRLRLGSETAKVEFEQVRADARQVVQEALKTDDLTGLQADKPGGSAFWLVWRHASLEDIPMLTRISECSDCWVAGDALCGLCFLDDPAAIAVVGKALADHSFKRRDFCVTGFLQDLAVSDLKNRHLYLGALANALRKCKDRGPDYHVNGLIDAFECMSGQDFTSKVSEEKRNQQVVKRANVGVGWNSSKGLLVNAKVVKEKPDPVSLVADECLRWYAETVAGSNK